MLFEGPRTENANDVAPPTAATQPPRHHGPPAASAPEPLAAANGTDTATADDLPF